MDHQAKLAVQRIVVSLHSVQEILENTLDRASEKRVERISERLNLDPKDGLRFMELEAHNVHDLAKQVQIKLSQCREKEKKEKSRMESMISSLMMENQDTRSMLEVAITEKEKAENSLRALKGDGDQRRSAILQIAGKGLQKVGFGFIMDVISGEPEGDETSSCGGSAASNGRESKQEVDSLVNSSASLLSTFNSAQKHSHLVIHQWSCICFNEEYFQVTLLREELRRIKTDLDAANSKIQLKEKLAASAMAAQAAADACLKLADSRSAGLQQRIEELTRQIEQEDAHARKGREGTRKRIRYVCWPWQQLRVISASSRARTWFVDQNGRLLPGTEALLQIRI